MSCGVAFLSSGSFAQKNPLAIVVQLNYNRQTQNNGGGMVSNAMIQARIDPAIKAQAGMVLESMGLTVSDAVRILMTRIAKEGALPLGFATDPAVHDAWFRAKVQAALDDPRPSIPHAEVEAHFAARRAKALSSSKGEA